LYVPLPSRADDTAAAASETAPVKKGKDSFLGSLVAVDTNAMTLTVSNLTLHVSATTKIKRGSQPATLADAVVGQPTSGTYEKGADGKLEALTLHLNSKAGGKGKGAGKKKKESTETPPSTGTNSTSSSN